MKNLWDKIWLGYSDLGTSLEEFINIIPQSPELYKQKIRVTRMYELLKKKVKEFDQYVTPISAVDVKIPKKFNTDDFIQAWQFWKDYLEEQHAVKMKSRMEVKSLARLVKLSEKDPEKAKAILEFAESTGYKNFFIPKNTVNKPDNTENYDPDFSS